MVSLIIKEEPSSSIYTYIYIWHGNYSIYNIVASVPKHLDELKALMVKKPVDIFSINETRLDATISNNEINIPGYVLFRKDRSRTGGGVSSTLGMF